MEKKLITNIENMLVHDASSFHSMTPNASSYTVQLGDSSSAFKSSIQVGIPTDLNEMLMNLTPNLVLRDTSNADIECYNKVEMDTVLQGYNTSMNRVETETGRVDNFDPYEAYVQNQLVWHDGQIWRCNVAYFQGQWNPSGWQATSLLGEIQDIRGINISGLETVNIHASVNRGVNRWQSSSYTL